MLETRPSVHSGEADGIRVEGKRLVLSPNRETRGKCCLDDFTEHFVVKRWEQKELTTHHVNHLLGTKNLTLTSTREQNQTTGKQAGDQV